jgi:RNA polymerase primary sigma factor
VVGAPGMQELVAELTRPMVLSDRTLRQLAQLRRAHREFVQRDRHQPNGGELALDTGLSREQVSDLFAVERLRQSLDVARGR